MIISSIGDSEAAYQVTGTYEDYLSLVLAVSAILVLIITITQMQGTIFKTKDYEFLESLPVGRGTIVAAKISAVYLMSFFEDVIIALPAVVLYFVFTGNVLNFILGLLAIFFVSLLPIMVSSLLGSLAALMTAKMKHGNILQTVIYIAYFALIFLFSFTLSSGRSIDASSLQNVLIYFKWFEKSLHEGSRIYYLFFLLIHLVSFLFVVLFISYIYRPMNNFIGNAKVHMNYEEGKDTSSVDYKKMLFKKEVKMVTSNSQYLVNSFMGPIFFLIMGVLFLFINFFGDIEGVDPSEYESLKIVMAFVVVMMGILMNSMMSSTSASISLESASFEQLLSYPIKAKEVINTKLKVGVVIPFILNILIGIILSLLWSFIKGFNLIFVLEIMILPPLASTITGIVGMLTGLRWPKLEFENQMQVMKNSKCVTLSMLFFTLPSSIVSMGLMIANIITVEASLIFQLIPFILGFVIYFVTLIIVYVILRKKGTSLYYKVITR